MDVLWLALAHPLSDEPDANELAEDLRNLGRRDKISFLPELIPVRLNQASVITPYVAGQTHAHIAG